MAATVPVSTADQQAKLSLPDEVGPNAARASKASSVPYLFALTLLALLSVVLRFDNLVHRPLLSHNEDAMAHVLITTQALANYAPAKHHFLPLIQYAGAANQHIDDFSGATVSDGAGLYFYVSFPPLGFVVPYAVLSAVGADITVLNLRWLSLATGIATVFGIFALVTMLLHGSEVEPRHRSLIALFAAVLYLFHAEAMWSHGNILWAHVLYQPILVAELILLCHLLNLATTLNHRNSPQAKMAAIAAPLLMFVGCCIDWSGYLFCAAVFFVGLFWYRRSAQRRFLWLSGSAAAAAVLAMTLLLWQWSHVTSIGQFLWVLAHRPRGHVAHTATSLTRSLELIGLFVLPMVLSGLLWFRPRRAQLAWLRADVAATSVCFCMLVTSLETFLFLQHSSWYAYGMLKLVLLSVLTLALLAASYRGQLGRALLGSALLCAGYGIALYFVQNPTHLKDTAFAHQFVELEKVGQYAAPNEAVYINVPWPLGVELARAGRNLVAPPTLSDDFTMAEAQHHLTSLPGVAAGKLFVFSRGLPGEEAPEIWWPATKTAFLAPSKYHIGVLLAVISFRADRVAGIRLLPSAISSSRAGKALTAQESQRAPELQLVSEVARLLPSGVTCIGPGGKRFSVTSVGSANYRGMSAATLKDLGLTEVKQLGCIAAAPYT